MSSWMATKHSEKQTPKQQAHRNLLHSLTGMWVCTAWHKSKSFLFSHFPSRPSWFVVHLVGSSYLLQFSISLLLHLFFPSHNLLLSCTVCCCCPYNFYRPDQSFKAKVSQPSNLPLIPLQMFTKTKEILATLLNHSVPWTVLYKGR